MLRNLHQGRFQNSKHFGLVRNVLGHQSLCYHASQAPNSESCWMLRMNELTLRILDRNHSFQRQGHLLDTMMYGNDESKLAHLQ